MKVYRRQEFLRLPEGAIYAKGERWCWGGLKIKADTTSSGNDWWSLDPADIDHHDCGEMVDRLEEMLEKGSSYPMNDALSRDGLHEEGALFLVFERNDLLVLRGAIDKAIETAPPEG